MSRSLHHVTDDTSSTSRDTLATNDTQHVVDGGSDVYIAWYVVYDTVYGSACYVVPHTITYT